MWTILRFYLNIGILHRYNWCIDPKHVSVSQIRNPLPVRVCCKEWNVSFWDIVAVRPNFKIIIWSRIWFFNWQGLNFSAYCIYEVCTACLSISEYRMKILLFLSLRVFWSVLRPSNNRRIRSWTKCFLCGELRSTWTRRESVLLSGLTLCPC